LKVGNKFAFTGNIKSINPLAFKEYFKSFINLKYQSSWLAPFLGKKIGPAWFTQKTSNIIDE